jgi:hypothetical protein
MAPLGLQIGTEIQVPGHQLGKYQCESDGAASNESHDHKRDQDAALCSRDLVIFWLIEVHVLTCCFGHLRRRRPHLGLPGF